MKHKEKILKLRTEGKSYREISKILQCSKGSVSYHCGQGQKEKSKLRVNKHRTAIHPYYRKLEYFIYRKYNIYDTEIKSTTKKLIYAKIYKFTNGDNMFTVQDIINKFGENPKCYLTGQDIDINKSRTYHFDHIIPVSRGGQNTLDNLGLCTREANQAKCNRTPDELFNLCKQILENNGYDVTKRL